MPILIRLFTDLTVYRQIIVSKLSSSLLRFCLTYLVISLGLGVWIDYYYSRQAFTVMDSVINQILIDIPETATFNLNSGILTTTATTSSTYLFIDSSADTPTLASSASILALGNTHFRFNSNLDGIDEIRSYQEEGWENVSLSGKDLRDQVIKFQSDIVSLKPYLPLLLTFPIFLFYFIARLTHSLFYALLLRIFGSSLNRAYNFTHYWQLTLHTVIVADTINILVLIIYQQNYPLVFTIAFFGTTLLTYLNLPVELKKSTSPPTK